MKMHGADLVSLLLIAAMFAVVGWFYASLPDPVPIHWNTGGEVDGYMAKPWGALIFPLYLVGIWVGFKLIPVISPRGFRLDRFLGVVRVIQLAVVGVTFVIGVVSLLAAAGWNVQMQWVVPLCVGVLFVVLGNYLGKVRRNFFIGVRTPWTLASEEVWNRTHRLAAWLFVFSGLLVILGTVAGWSFWLSLAALVSAGLVPVAYSLWLYHRVEGFPGND